jgi:hypothetical protein
MAMNWTLRQIKRATMWLFLRGWIKHETVERIFAELPLKHK